MSFATNHAPQHALNPAATSQFAWPASSLGGAPSVTPAASRTARGRAPAPRRPEPCGWFDSSFDLAQGLDITEQDSDTLYQLWELSRQ